MNKIIFTFLFLVFPITTFSAISENDIIVDNGNAYIVATVVNAGDGFRSVAQLWNPVGSGRVVYLDKVTLSHGYCAAKSGIDLRSNSSPMGAVFINGTNKNFSISAQSITQLRSAHTTTPVSDFTMYEIFPGECYKDRTILFLPPLRIPSGRGAYLATGNNGANMPITFEFREY